MPIIGISASIIVDQSGMFPGYHRSYVNEDYVNSVIRNGGVACILPISDNEEVLDSYLEIIDGLILSGGHDICSFNYNEEPSPKMGDIFPARDKFDFALLERATKKGIPILGICRGAKIINVYHGGALYQDLSYCDTAKIKHWQGSCPDMVTHSVDVEDDSLLHQILRVNKITVNSFHHQIMKDVAKEFNVVGRAPDGVIEAIEHTDYPFMIGVQWHPEMLHRVSEEMNRIFAALIDHAQQKKLKQSVVNVCQAG